MKSQVISSLLYAMLGLTMTFCEAQKPATVADRVSQYGPKVRPILQRAFSAAGVSYPGKAVTLLYVKENQTLGVYAGDDATHLRLIKSYNVLAKSGGPGPKLRHGDEQIPEGFYNIEALNPNSLFHLSLRVNYPNSFDKEQAKREGRANLGSDIMIHGNSVSIGCIAIGDPAIEELFVLAAESNFSLWNLMLSPCQSKACFETLNKQPAFMQPVYKKLANDIHLLKQPKHK